MESMGESIHKIAKLNKRRGKFGQVKLNGVPVNLTQAAHDCKFDLGAISRACKGKAGIPFSVAEHLAKQAGYSVDELAEECGLKICQYLRPNGGKRTTDEPLHLRPLIPFVKPKRKSPPAEKVRGISRKLLARIKRVS